MSNTGTGSGGRKTPTSGTTGRNRNAFCSFCRKSYRDVGPLVEGPGDVYICGECVELCQSIIDQERKRRGITKTTVTNKNVTMGAEPNSLYTNGGTALMIHAAADDMKTDPGGAAGDRIICGTITK